MTPGVEEEALVWEKRGKRGSEGEAREGERSRREEGWRYKGKEEEERLPILIY